MLVRIYFSMSDPVLYRHTFIIMASCMPVKQLQYLHSPNNICLHVSLFPATPKHTTGRKRQAGFKLVCLEVLMWVTGIFYERDSSAISFQKGLKRESKIHKIIVAFLQLNESVEKLLVSWIWKELVKSFAAPPLKKIQLGRDCGCTVFVYVKGVSAGKQADNSCSFHQTSELMKWNRQKIELEKNPACP